MIENIHKIRNAKEERTNSTRLGGKSLLHGARGSPRNMKFRPCPCFSLHKVNLRMHINSGFKVNR